MQPPGGLLDRVNLLIITVLAVAVAGSALGAVTYEDARLGTPFRVAWTTSTDTITVDPQSVQGAGSAETSFTLDQRNVTSLQVSVTVAGSAPARPQAVPFLVELVRPDTNETIQAEGSLPAGPAGSVTVDIPVELAQVPEVESATGASPEAAIESLARQHGKATGQGEWILRVTFSPGAPGPLDVETRTVSAEVLVESYSAEVTPDTPDVQER